MMQNRVKRILREGGMALGTYVGGIADPQIVEIIGHAGFDAAFIDLEHTSFDLRDVQLMVMAAERMGIAPIVRALGVTGQTDHPKLVETISRVADVVRRSGVTRLALPMATPFSRATLRNCARSVWATPMARLHPKRAC